MKHHITFAKFAIGAVVTFLLLGAMVRTRGVAAIPFLFVTFLALSYVAFQIFTGGPTPHPRYASGVLNRTEETDITLSPANSCASCTDSDGDGVRQTTHKEFVLFGVPLVHFDEDSESLCEVCANPLDAHEDMDYIDRELALESEQN